MVDLGPDTGSLDLLALLADLQVQGGRLPAPDARWLVVAPHPDDETLGASWVMRRARSLHVVHVTDGAPTDRALWSRHGFGTRRDYAAVRARELRAALDQVNLPAGRHHWLGWVDQEAMHALVDLTGSFVDLLRRLAPAVVVLPPFEGGHPDHDATAFAVHAAVRLLHGAGRTPPLLIEMTSYHRWNGTLRTGHFLSAIPRVVERVLSAEDRLIKSRMLDCFASQVDVLASFTVGTERYRLAPAYDFCLPPHPGPLHYESLAWRPSAASWCRLAACALGRWAWTRTQLAPSCGEPEPGRTAC